jgi:EpsI family protein
MPPFLLERHSLAATAALLIGCFAYYGPGTTTEATPTTRPLTALPKTIGPWATVHEGVVEKETQEVLRADDTLVRTYAASQTGAVNLFMALFKSQRTGVTPHSPKNCLPGSGWIASKSDIVAVPLTSGTAIEVNRYIVSKGDSKSLVMYWYQSHNRVVASEYWAKIYLVLDSIRYRRSDTSIVRVVVPISGDEASAESAAIQFVQQAFGAISEILPA